VVQDSVVIRNVVRRLGAEATMAGREQLHVRPPLEQARGEQAERAHLAAVSGGCGNPPGRLR
jgi:hypothetical protein